MKKEISAFVYIVLGLATAGLITAGLCLIIQSQQLHQKAVEFAREMIAAHVATATAPSFTLIKDSYAQALLFFMLAVGLLIITILLPRIQSFNIGTAGINVTLSQLQENIKNLTKQTNSLQQQSVRFTTSSEKEFSKSMLAITNTPIKPGDQQKDDRRIHATKRAIGIDTEFTITVESTDSKKPLQGLVTFHLPAYFLNRDPQIAPIDGKAVLQLVSPGPFVVAATIVNEEISLAVDLANATM